MATYQEALDHVLRVTGVSNGGVTVIRVSPDRGVAFVETIGAGVLGVAAFDWSTVSPDMRHRPVEDALTAAPVESRA